MVYGIYQLLSRLPLSILYGLATVGAWALEHVFRYRRSVITSNLSQSFPHLTAEEIQGLRRRFYRSLADTTLEIIGGAHTPLEFFTKRIDVTNIDLLHELSQQGSQTVIVMLGHQGNWEWMLHRAAAEYDMPMAFIYKTLHSAAADRFSLEARCRFGAEAIEMHKSARNMIRNRRKPRIIYILGDQSPGQRERVHWARFLNRDTPFFSGAAVLAKATGYPVAFAACRRTKRGHYHVSLSELAAKPKELEEEEITARYARALEQAIERAPEDWLWSNRRWKYQAEASSSAPASAADRDIQSNPSD